MTFEECRALYLQKRGQDDLTPLVLFPDTPQEYDLFLPYWAFSAHFSPETGLYVAQGTGQAGASLTVQDDIFENMPDKILARATAVSLAGKNRADFIFALTAGRLLLLEEEFDYAETEGGFTLTRDNLVLSWQGAKITLTESGDEYFSETLPEGAAEAALQPAAEQLLRFSEPVRASVSQEELFGALAERYPDLPFTRIIHLGKVNTCVIQAQYPLPAYPQESLWLVFNAEDANVGIYPFTYANDIGLHPDAVAAPIDEILAGEVILLLSKKSEDAPAKTHKYEWVSKGKRTPEDISLLLQGRLKGLFNRVTVAESISNLPEYCVRITKE